MGWGEGAWRLLLTSLDRYTIGVTIASTLGQMGGGGGASRFATAFVTSPGFRDIFISLAATYGMYFLTSLLYGEPWHMLTSFVQYLFMMPSFTNILMVYAFCNTHDVSWGTKGDNKVSDLGAAKPVSDGKTQHVEVELPFADLKDKTALNDDYTRWLAALPNRPKEERQKRDANTKMQDWHRNFRTQLVLWWMFSNALLVIVMTHPQIVEAMGGGNPNYNPYLAFLFYAVLGLTGFRFIGSILYLITHVRNKYFCRC